PNLTRLTGNCANCGRRVVNDPPDEPAGSLPTADEFTAADRRVPFRDWLAPLVLFPLMLVLMAGFLLVNPSQLWTTLEQRCGKVVAAILAFAVVTGCLFVQFGIAIAGARWVARRHRRKQEAEPLLNCPHCREVLSPARLVVASKRCPACRRRVLDDPEPA